MDMKTLLKAVWRYAQFLISFALILASVSAMYVAFTFLSVAYALERPAPAMQKDIQESMPGYDQWTYIIKEAQTPLERNALLEITPAAVNITLEAKVDAGTRLAEILADHAYINGMRSSPPPLGFMSALFGIVRVQNNFDVNWEGPYWSSNEKTNQIIFSYKGTLPIKQGTNVIFVNWASPFNGDMQLNVYKARIVFDDMIFRSSSITPSSIRPNEITFQNAQGLYLNPVNVLFETSPTKPNLTRQQYINNIGDISPPLFSRLLFALVELAPLVLLSILAYGFFKSSAKIPAALTQLTLGLLGVHFILYFFMAHVDIYTDYFGGAVRALMMGKLAMYLMPDAQARLGNDIYRAFIPLFVAVVCVLFPLVLPRLITRMGIKDESARQEVDKKRGWLLLFILETLPVVVAIFSGYWFLHYAQSWYGVGNCWALPADLSESARPASLTYWQAYWQECGIPQWAPLFLALSMSILFTRWAISLMASSLWGEETNAMTSWVVTFVILFMTAYSSAFERYFQWQPRQSWGWMAFNVLFGALLLYQLGMAALRYAKALQIPFNVDRISRWLLVFAFIFAIPSYYGDGRSQDFSYPDDLARLFFALDNIFIYIWFAAILWLLYKDGKTDLSLNKHTRWLGALGLASVLFNVTNRWMYIPAAFLFGWLALSWLMRRQAWDEKLNLDRAFKQVMKMRAAMLHKISLLRLAEHTLGALQKKKRERISAGDEDFSKARKGIVRHVAAIEKLRKESLKGVDRDFQHIPLAFGPKSAAWENGLHGAKWSALIALPWLALNFVSLLQGTSFSRAYALSFVDSILSILAFWLGIGFVLGYFFPYLRGDNGLQKGIRLALVLILPTIPLHILHYQTLENWQGFCFWVFQVFFVCTLLGLFAFDYLTIRETGKNWETLLEIHGLFPVGAWMSGVTAGLFAAITSWLTNPAQIQAWLNSAAQIILPVASQADKMIR